MIGPSSSHTAGAARIGYIAKKIAAFNVKKAVFNMHGSFAETYMGHGTDKALLAGVAGMLPDDEKIKHIKDYISFEYEFNKKKIEGVHPNSVEVVLYSETESIKVVASSIGAGKIKVIKIDNIDVDFEGEYNTIIIHSEDRKGVLSSFSTYLLKDNINIVFMKAYREEDSENSVMVVETDEHISEDFITDIKQKIKEIDNVKVIEKI